MIGKSSGDIWGNSIVAFVLNKAVFCHARYFQEIIVYGLNSALLYRKIGHPV
jgi:hypothetical protein